MAITAKQRKALPKSDFAGPGRTYPDDTPARARNALSRVAQNGTPAVQKMVRRNVAKKDPQIAVTGISKKHARTGKP